MEVSRVGNWLRIDTPAKLNLFLEVLARRSDGFHEIETLMTPISISDTLFVTDNAEGSIQLSCSWASGIEARRKHVGDEVWGELPSGSNNLVFKAVDRLRLRAGADAGIAIHLVKRIPSASGMGGASSDAAAALVAANELWGLGWNRQQLADVAQEIGSDTSFFLSERGRRTAICRGRGEKIDAIAAPPPLHFVVAKPPAGLSTATVYEQCTVPSRPKSVFGLLEAMRRGDRREIGKRIFNRLEEAALRLCPWIDKLRRVFEQTDVLGHQMSGSGTSYFGICHSARHASRVASRLRSALQGEVCAAYSRS